MRWFDEADRFLAGKGDDQSPPAVPDVVDRLRYHAWVTAVWSPQVAELAFAWAQTVWDAGAATRQVANVWKDGKFLIDLWGKADPEVPAHRSVQLKTAGSAFVLRRQGAKRLQCELGEQIWRELRGESDGYPATIAS